MTALHLFRSLAIYILAVYIYTVLPHSVYPHKSNSALVARISLALIPTKLSGLKWRLFANSVSVYISDTHVNISSRVCIYIYIQLYLYD